MRGRGREERGILGIDQKRKGRIEDRSEDGRGRRGIEDRSEEDCL